MALRIAMMVDRFPVVSETFVLGQITALLDLGHEVDVYARWRPPPGMPVHPDVDAYRLLERTTYVDELLPEESGYWELPARPADGWTWVPGAEAPIRNRDRLAAAEPVVERCRAVAPEATDEVLDADEYGYQAESLSALYRLDVLASSGRSYDVVHAHFGPAANTFRFARLLWHAPLVVTFHGYDLMSFVREQGPGVYRALFADVAAVTVNSRYCSALVHQLGCPPALITHLPVGVDVERITARTDGRRPEGPLRVLTVARLVPVKGVRYLVEAAGLATCPLEIDVVGDGPLLGELADLCDRTLPAGAVRFHRALDADGVHRLLADCDVFVLPSVAVDGQEEAQGLVLQEAQAAGVPVVSTATGGIPEGVLDGVSGLLVPPADPRSIAAALDQLAGSPDIRLAMGRAGRRLVVERFDQAQLVRRLVDVYEAAVAGRTARVPA